MNTPTLQHAHGETVLLRAFCTQAARNERRATSGAQQAVRNERRATSSAPDVWSTCSAVPCLVMCFHGHIGSSSSCRFPAVDALFWPWIRLLCEPCCARLRFPWAGQGKRRSRTTWNTIAVARWSTRPPSHQRTVAFRKSAVAVAAIRSVRGQWCRNAGSISLEAAFATRATPMSAVGTRIS